PLFVDDDSREPGSHLPKHDIAFSRQNPPELFFMFGPSKVRGRRECRVLAATHGPRAVKKHGEGTTGSAGSSGIPCAMVLTLIARSPWEPGFIPPIAREIIVPRAWPQRREARPTPLRRPHRLRSSGEADTSIAAPPHVR